MARTRFLAGLKLLLIGVGLLLTNFSFASRLADLLAFQKHLALLAFVGIWCVALLTLIYVAFMPQRKAQVSWSVLLGVSTLIGSAYHRVVDQRLTMWSLDAMWDFDLVDAGAVFPFMHQVIPAILGTVALLSGLLLPHAWERLRAPGTLVLLPAVPFVLSAGLVFVTASSQGHETKAMPNQFLNLALLGVYLLEPRASSTKAAVQLIPRFDPAARVIMVVVDESISGDFIDLNQPRGTTPYLSRSVDSVINFGLASAASTCSNSSNAVLRLGADPDRLGQQDYDLLGQPGIWRYAHDAGYATHYLQALDYAQRLQNFMTRTELADIDDIFGPRGGEEIWSLDSMLIPRIEAIVAAPGRHFIFVNKWGAHFPYPRSYPPEQEFFAPAMTNVEPIRNRELLVNSYKNSVRWSVDGFFEQLLTRLDLRDVVIIYTSDHGQNLLDDGTLVTHCRPFGGSAWEALVPMLVWAGPGNVNARFRRALKHNLHRSSHFEVFPTVLELFGYEPNEIRRRYHGSLFRPIDSVRGFTTGPLTGRFHGKPRWHERPDYQALKR